MTATCNLCHMGDVGIDTGISVVLMADKNSDMNSFAKEPRTCL